MKNPFVKTISDEGRTAYLIYFWIFHYKRVDNIALLTLSGIILYRRCNRIRQLFWYTWTAE